MNLIYLNYKNDCNKLERNLNSDRRNFHSHCILLLIK